MLVHSHVYEMHGHRYKQDLLKDVHDSYVGSVQLFSKQWAMYVFVFNTHKDFLKTVFYNVNLFICDPDVRQERGGATSTIGGSGTHLGASRPPAKEPAW